MSLEIVVMAGRRPYPPRPSNFTRQFWNGLTHGHLTTTRCRACDRPSFPPKPFCPYCWSREIAWTELSGHGYLYSYTVVHVAPQAFAAQVPYRVGIVDLEEGLRVAAGLWGREPLVLDQSMIALILQYEDGPLFAFRGLDIAPP